MQHCAAQLTGSARHEKFSHVVSLLPMPANLPGMIDGLKKRLALE
jgi:hypothetical protein